MSSLSRASARLPVRLIVAAAVIALLASCRPMSNPEASLFAATNELRVANGLPVYQQHEALVDQARAWAASMAARQELSHSDPYQWNVAWTSVAENVGRAKTIETIFQSLADSSYHRANMLSGAYTHMAIGTARGKDGRLYAVQLFWRG